jgi:hypothetical protein
VRRPSTRRISCIAAAVASSCLLLPPELSGHSTDDARWKLFVRVPGAVDVGGPRSDGRVVVAGRDGLFLLRSSGALAPLARGPAGYKPPRGEPYIAVATTRRVPRAGCAFRRDAVYALDPIDRPGVNVVDRTGHVHRLLDLPSGSFLSSIAFDTVGRFGYRLLVTAVVANKTTLYAVDCRGRTRVIARGVVRLEGGSAVAPRTFGRFGGWLVAVDESGGGVYAFDAAGHVRLVIRPRAPAGGDVGVETVGFVPRGFGRGGIAYLADLGAPGSPTQGSDSVLSLSGGALARARVAPGDLLVATEASGVTFAVRCRRRCEARRIGRALDATHGEGHIAFARR